MINRRQLLKSGLAAGSALLIPKTTQAATKWSGVLADSIKLNDLITEKRKIFNKWNKVFAFHGLAEQQAIELAVQLENQRLWNEVCVHNGNTTDENAQFNRISIPVIYRAFLNCASKDWVSFQTMMRPVQPIFWENKGFQSEEIPAHTKKYKSIWAQNAANDLESCRGLDAEAELSSILSYQMAMELDREVATDLKMNAPQFTCNSKNIVNFIDGRFKFDLPEGDDPYPIKKCVQHSYEWEPSIKEQRLVPVGRKYGKAQLIDSHKTARWVLAAPEICDKIKQHKDFVPENVPYYSSFGIHIIGAIHSWLVYQDPLYPVNQALLGCKFGHYNSGYIMAHYVPISLTPTIISTESFCPRKGVLVRYGKRLVNHKMYANVTF